MVAVPCTLPPPPGSSRPIPALPTSSALADSAHGVVRGIVFHADSGGAIAEATMILRGIDPPTPLREAIATSDSVGGFLLERVEPGRYLRRVRRLGYGTIDDTVTIRAGVEARMEIRLRQTMACR